MYDYSYFIVQSSGYSNVFDHILLSRGHLGNSSGLSGPRHTTISENYIIMINSNLKILSRSLWPVGNSYRTYNDKIHIFKNIVLGKLSVPIMASTQLR